MPVKQFQRKIWSSICSKKLVRFRIFNKCVDILNQSWILCSIREWFLYKLDFWSSCEINLNKGSNILHNLFFIFPAHCLLCISWRWLTMRHGLVFGMFYIILEKKSLTSSNCYIYTYYGRKSRRRFVCIHFLTLLLYNTYLIVSYILQYLRARNIF